MTAPDASLPNKHQVRRSFDRAAAHYDHYADLQRRVGVSLLERLDWAPEQVRLVVDVGSGTGGVLPRLAERFPVATLVAVDMAEEMLRIGRARLAQGRFVCGDAEALPLACACADLLYSNLALQWCGAVERPLAEFARVLRPGGMVAFSLFGMGTLQELRQAWRTVDDQRRVNDFVAVADLRAALVRARFSCVDIQERREMLEYASVGELMRELKGLGAHNVSGARPRHLTGKSVLARMESAYGKQMAGGPIRATYAIIYVLAHKL